MVPDGETQSYQLQVSTCKLFAAINLLLSKCIDEDKALTKIKKYLNNGADVNAINYNDGKRNTLLHIAVQHGCLQIVDFLLENVWDIKTDVENTDRQTIVTLAAQSTNENIKSSVEAYANKSRSALKIIYSSNDPSQFIKAIRNTKNILKIDIDSTNLNPLFLSEEQFFEVVASCASLILVDITTTDTTAQYEQMIKSQLATIDKPLIFQFGPVDSKIAYFYDSVNDEITVIDLKTLEENFNDNKFNDELSSANGFGLKLIVNALQQNLFGQFNGPHCSLSNVKFFDTEKNSLIRHVIERGDLLTLNFLCLHIKPEDLLVNFVDKFENVDKLSAIVTVGMLQSNELPSQLQNFKNTALKAAVKTESFEITKLLIEQGAEMSQEIINIAYTTQRYDIVLLLLKADSVYPQGFDLEQIHDTNNEKFQALKQFVDIRNMLHTLIEDGDLTQVKKLVQSMGTSKTYLNKCNQSAVYTALKSNRIQIYVWLKSQMGAELKDENETSNISKEDLLNAETSLARVESAPIEDAHIMHLVSISKSFHTQKEDFKQTVENFYKKLDRRRPQVSNVLKVVQCGQHLDIIYDLETDSIKNSALAHSSVKGECDYIAGRIHIGGKREEKEVLGTIAHELTHQAMQILFENDTKPYKQDPYQQNKFNQVVNTVIDSISKCNADEIIKNVFLVCNKKFWHSELIVRVNHMIGKYGQKVGTLLLSEQAPQLLKHYDKKIDPKCEQLIKESHQLGARTAIKLLNDYSGVIANLQDKNVFLNKPIAQSYKMGVINCVITDYILLGSINILNSLKDESGTFLFFNYGRYLNRRNDVHKVFNYDVCKTLILVCGTKPDKPEFDKSVAMLMEILQQQNNKQVIFIMKDDMNLKSSFKIPLEVPISSKDLSDDTVKMLLESAVSFQDNKLQLKTLIDKEMFRTIDPHTLSKIINRKEIEIGSRVVIDPKYDELRDYHIQRTFDRNITISQRIKDDSDFHIVYNSFEVDEHQVSQSQVAENQVGENQVGENQVNENQVGENEVGENQVGENQVNENQVGENQVSQNQVADNQVHENQVGEYQVGKNRDLVLISNSEEDFQELCTKHSDRNIHWLKTEEVYETLRWQKSEGSLSRLREYSYKMGLFRHSDDKLNHHGDDELIFKDKFAMVVAEAGMGKSTVLSHVALKMKQEEKEEVWLTRVNLVDYSTELNRLKKENVQMNEKEAVKFLYVAMDFQLFKMKQNETEMEKEKRRNLIQEVLSSVVVKGHNIIVNKSCPFEIQLFNQMYNRGNVVLLFDGFDEINPDYKVQVIQLLNVLQGSKVKKIWVTTRPLDYRELEVSLDTFSHRLKPFRDADQKLFLKLFWATKLKPDKFDDDTRSGVFIDELLSSFSKTIKDDKRSEAVYNIETEFLSVPLHIQMIADVYQNKLKEFYGSKSEKPQEKIFNEEHNLVSLFKTFFAIKFFKILYGDKSPNVNADDPKMRFLLEHEYKDVEQDHTQLAIYTLNSENDVETLFTPEEQSKLLCLIDKIQQSKERTGIIDRIANGKPIFVHQTFAEYFAALWFERKRGELVVKDFLAKHIFQREQEVTRNFFDLMLANNGQSQIHMAVINRDLHATRELLQTKDIEAVDSGGRTALHVAVAYGYEDFVQLLLEHSAQVNCVDDLFNWKPIRYVDNNRHWGTAELLLQSGADGEDMSETIEFINLIVETDGKTPLHIAADKGYMNLVQLLISKGALIDKTAHYNITPLHSAALSGNLEIAKYLIDNNADLEADYFFGRKPLHAAARNGNLEIVKYLLENGGKLDSKNDCNATPLIFAAELGHLEVVKYLVDNNADLTSKDGFLKTALHYAAEKGHFNVLKYLFEKDASVARIQTRIGMCPLHAAAENGHLNIMQFFLDKNFDVNIASTYNETPLHIAAYKGKLEAVQFLVKNGADLNIKNTLLSTPLHQAVEKDKLKVVEFLVDSGAHLDVENKYGRTALTLAAERGQLEMVQCMMEKVTNLTDDTKKFVIEKVVRNGHLEVLKLFIEKDVNFCINGQYNILHLAINCSRLAIVQYLIENNADVNAINEYGQTPLHFAVDRKSLELVKCLVDKGAHLNVKAINGGTPVGEAVYKSHLEIVKYLVGKKANLNIKDNLCYIPIQSAAAFGHLEILKYLCKKPTNLSVELKQSLLHLSAGHGELEVLQYLVENVAPLKTTDTGSKTTVHYAAKKGRLDIVRYLISQKVEINVKTEFKQTSVYLAAVNDHLDVVKCLLDNGAGINVSSERGQTLLHVLAQKGNLDMVRNCVAKGAFVNCVDDDGWTPLHFAIFYGALEIVKYFVNEINVDVAGKATRYGALFLKFNDLVNFSYYTIPEKDSMGTNTNNGVTPMHLAALSDNIHMIKFLFKRGVSINECDLHGWTPIEIAVRFSKKNSVQFFRTIDVPNPGISLIPVPPTPGNLLLALPAPNE